MEMYNKINSLLKEMGASKKNMCDELEIPYNSLMSMFNRQSKNIALGTVQSIANYLSVTVDYLISDEITNVDYGKNNSSPFVDPDSYHNNPTTITDSSEEELVTTYRELNTDNKAYIRVRSKELLKDQISTEKTEASDDRDTQTFKIASRNGKSELELTEEQRKAIAETIMNHKKTDVGDLI